MFKLKVVAAGLGLLGILFAFPVTSMAAGGGGATCFSVGAGGTALTGSVSTYISNSDGSNADLDSILILKYKSKTEAFRVHVVQADITSEGAALCGILDEGPTRDGDNATILEAFGLAGHVLQINNTSIPETQLGLIPGGGGASMSFSNVTIFVE